ncbi:MAG: hypothetical protein Q7U14_07860, partial [Lacisediminimonas sp.]|nr:hypothetical protein [Lacisediminimonas sp.]
MSEDNLLWWPKPRFTEARFRPYVAAIGQASLAWNELHEHLGRLFCYLVPAPSRNLPLALWQSQRVDRSKRELMKAALAAIPPGDNIHVQRPLLRDDLEWLLGRVEAMEEPRNNTVHAPLQLMLDMGKPKAFNAQT